MFDNEKQITQMDGEVDLKKARQKAAVYALQATNHYKNNKPKQK